jgi:hypothetical protein
MNYIYPTFGYDVVSLPLSASLGDMVVMLLDDDIRVGGI